MGECVFVYGKSGTGKSRSLKGFGEEEIFLINCVGKRLPFQNKFKYVMRTTEISKMKEKLAKMPCKVAVIDDAGYIMTSRFMNSHGDPKADKFDLYNNIADDMWKLINFVKTGLPDDVIVYLLFHEESNDFGEVKIRTIGKLLDQKVCLEGLVTVVLRCVIDADKQHKFITNGDNISKSPEDMFELEIDNDLKFVDTRIREYWGIGAEAESNA